MKGHRMSETIVNVKAGTDEEDGRAAYEEALVEPCGNGAYRLVRSPALTQGLAAGDVFTVNAEGDVTLISRGNNVCIQIYTTSDVRPLEAAFTPRMEAVGAWLDGMHPKVLVYTVPVRVGFPVIERPLKTLASLDPAAEWYFGNVYDEDGVTPLRWWERLGGESPDRG